MQQPVTIAHLREAAAHPAEVDVTFRRNSSDTYRLVQVARQIGFCGFHHVPT